ncbi:YugN-like family protein [Alkalicoccobacillus gibsonii]|uniref:YugN-like family protein n=1 Tax=Alkalicoccobacillus gibsonii TaxID=79881 RepID=UPI001932F9F8|nr:YugN-like family protein [Alkalicoccobacillus gibsonii]MBM0066280.1 YugN-like family protein [Alkalicoccobacillus gibsonii]
MIPLQSAIIGETYKLGFLEEQLKPKGYTIGSNWDYDHGYFDYTIEQHNGYTVLRIPFHTRYGEVGERGTTVTLDTPFILAHEYQEDLDDYATSGSVPLQVSGVVNQFSEPTNKDGEVDEKYVPTAQNLLKEVESLLIP